MLQESATLDSRPHRGFQCFLAHLAAELCLGKGITEVTLVHTSVDCSQRLDSLSFWKAKYLNVLKTRPHLGMVSVIENRPLKTQIDIESGKLQELWLCIYRGKWKHDCVLNACHKIFRTLSCVGLELCCIRNILNGGTVVCCGCTFGSDGDRDSDDQVHPRVWSWADWAGK